MPESKPKTMAPTPNRTVIPSPRRTHLPAANDCLIAANSWPPINRTAAREVAAPAASASKRSVVLIVAPLIAAPVSSSARIGPAHGAKQPGRTPKQKSGSNAAAGSPAREPGKEITKRHNGLRQAIGKRAEQQCQPKNS